MANTLENTLNKVGNAIESVLGSKQNKTYVSNQIQSEGQSNLERFGRVARQEHIKRNEWRYDLGYSKPLVDAEYLIQTEFKVTSLEDRLKEQEAVTLQKKAEKAQKKAEKAQKKADEAEEKKRKMLLN